MKDLSNLILLFSNLSALYPIVKGWKIKGLLWYYAWISLLADVAGYLIKWQHWPRFIHANLFLLLEFILVGKYLLGIILKPGQQKAAMILIFLLSALFVLRTGLQTPLQTNYVDGAVFYGLYIVLCVGALYRVIQQLEHLKLEHSEVFIFSSAFLLYASGSLIMLLFKIKLNEDHRALITKIWDVRNVLNILKNFAIGYMFVAVKRKAIVGNS